MKFIATPLPGAYLIELEPMADERGFFARSFCREEFEAHGLNPAVAQCSVSYNRIKGTLRGLHYQSAPYAEAKLVRCVAGAIYSVIVDLRKTSPMHGHWIGFDLSAKNRKMLFVPEGVANGFQTLVDESEVQYQISVPYHAEAQSGLRWNDPQLAIPWPVANPILSERDRALPLLREIIA